MSEAARATEPSSDEKRPAPDRKPALFRSEAVAAQAARLDGEVILAQPLASRLLGLLAMAVVGAGLIFVSTATYARMETVAGWVVPEGGLIRVGARQGGIVERIQVVEGDEVIAGQALATVNLSADFDAGNAGLLMTEQLQAEAEATQAQAQARRQQLLAELSQVDVQIEALGREVAEGRDGLSTLEERVGLLSGIVRRAEGLAERGVVTQANIEETRMAELLARQDVSQARSGILNYERQIADLEARRGILPIEIEAADAQARLSDAALAQRRTEAAVRHGYVVGASIAGRVVAIAVSAGQDVAAGGMVATITPADSRLEAELFIPSRAAGFIRPGQDVRLMYQAFPYQKFGTAVGTVDTVSRTVLGPNDIAVPGLEIREPVFRVKVVLPRETVTAYGEDIPIQPGMLLSADVIIDRRTLLEWLLDPLYAVGRMG